jgi:hypothetical protein
VSTFQPVPVFFFCMVCSSVGAAPASYCDFDLPIFFSFFDSSFFPAEAIYTISYKWSYTISPATEADKMEHGDCDVPQLWAEDPGLGNWVQRQRSNKPKLDAGKPALGVARV